MAKTYRAPEGYEAPDFMDFMVDGGYDRDADDKAHAAYIDRLATLARSQNKGDLVGEVVRFPAADGYAQYMIWSHSPCTLIHLAIHDAWSIPEAHARGLRISDLRDMVERDRRLAAMFAERQAARA